MKKYYQVMAVRYTKGFGCDDAYVDEYSGMIHSRKQDAYSELNAARKTFKKENPNDYLYVQEVEN